jgi:AcrR family transcriptional regulator
MDKQKEILNAALKLFVEFGFHGTPTSKIANEAGVANGTLFHYYKTKDDLVIALYNSIKQDLSAYLFSKIGEHDSLETKFKTIFIHTLNWALAHRQQFYYIQQFHLSPHITKISEEVIQQQTKPHLMLIEEGMKAKVLKPMPVQLNYTLVSSYIFGIYQYLTSTDLSPAKQKKIIADSYQMMWEMISIK